MKPTGLSTRQVDILTAMIYGAMLTHDPILGWKLYNSKNKIVACNKASLRALERKKFIDICSGEPRALAKYSVAIYCLTVRAREYMYKHYGISETRMIEVN